MSIISEQVTKIKLRIGGMTCVHCQDKIQSELSNTEGIVSVKVSYGSGTAKIEYDTEVIGVEEIKQIVEALDYRVLSEDDANGGRKKLIYPFLLFAIILAIFLPLQGVGLLNYLAPAELADSSMSYGMLFVIGLITSVHCIAMCGGINLSQCIPKAEDGVRKGFKAFIPAVFYNLGRVIAYTVIGFILGLVGWLVGDGMTLGISNIVQGVFKIVAGILMIVMGVNMLGIIPALRKFNVTLPKFLRNKIDKKKSTAKNPFIVGLLNGIMPCGPLQSMWLVALATGNPLSGALSMFLFALGTVPLMLGLGSIVTKLGQKFTKTVMTVGSLLVVILGLAMLSQGGSLTGFGFFAPTILASVTLALIFAGIVCSLPLETNSLKRVARITACCFVLVVGALAIWINGKYALDGSFDVSKVNGNGQTVTSTLDSGTYPNISVTKGIPVKWKIIADEGSINGCNYKIQIPEYDIEYIFHEGENVIEFTPTKTGSFDYCCWMGMIYGKIVVTN